MTGPDCRRASTVPGKFSRWRGHQIGPARWTLAPHPRHEGFHFPSHGPGARAAPPRPAPGSEHPSTRPPAVLPWTTPIPRPAPGSGERAAKLVHPDLIPELDRLEPSLKDVTRRRCAPWNPTDSRGSNRRCVSRGVIRRITPAVRHGCSSTRTRALGPEPPHGQPSPDHRGLKIPASADGPSSAGPGRYRAHRPRPPKPKRLVPA